MLATFHLETKNCFVGKHKSRFGGEKKEDPSSSLIDWPTAIFFFFGLLLHLLPSALDRKVARKYLHQIVFEVKPL